MPLLHGRQEEGPWRRRLVVHGAGPPPDLSSGSWKRGGGKIALIPGGYEIRGRMVELQRLGGKIADVVD